MSSSYNKALIDFLFKLNIYKYKSLMNQSNDTLPDPTCSTFEN